MINLPPTQRNLLGVQFEQGVNFADVFQMLVENQNRFSNAFCPPYPRLVGLVAAKFNRVTSDRDARLSIMSQYLKRPITSTKDMTTAECVVWLKMLERPQFVEYLKEALP